MAQDVHASSPGYAHAAAHDGRSPTPAGGIREVDRIVLMDAFLPGVGNLMLVGATSGI